MNNARIGLGFDVHKFDDTRTLMLGAVHIDGHAGLAGHSDADVVFFKEVSVKPLKKTAK